MDLNISYEKLAQVYRQKGFIFFTGAFDINVFGIRNGDLDQSKDSFNDHIGIAYNGQDGQNIIKLYNGTTDPGLLELKDPSFEEAKKNGTFIMKEGQYLGAYQLGWHGTGAWQHRALIQVAPICGYRDRNRDAKLDLVDPSKGNYAVNIHASSLWGELDKIGRYSAGCQVFEDGREFAEFIAIIKNQPVYGHGDRFTYTLFNESDFA